MSSTEKKPTPSPDITLETVLYELKPLLCLGLGVYVLSTETPNMWMVGFATLLVFTALMILRLRMRARRGSRIETWIYEAQPYVYLAVGAASIALGVNNRRTIGFALILMVCATLILRLRWKRRK